jgi:hypothetical protein
MHYEDYSRPEDEWPDLLTDDYITAGRDPHEDNCIADFLDTSKSTRENYYGWNRASDVIPAFEEYVDWRAPAYTRQATRYEYGSTLTWSVLTAEVDAHCPMVFLVDADGNGETDHFVTVIGYRDDNGYEEYACLDTWHTDVRWCRFREMSSSYNWGVRCGWSFRVNSDDVIWVDFAASGIPDGSFEHPYSTLAGAVAVAGDGDTIVIKEGSSNDPITIAPSTPMTFLIRAFGGSAIVG